MSTEMHKRKKKIVLKNKVFDFTSTNDILANRDQKRKEEEELALIAAKEVHGDDYFEP